LRFSFPDYRIGPTPLDPEQNADDRGSNKHNHDYHFSVSWFERTLTIGSGVGV
jgi:hypothetical protein